MNQVQALQNRVNNLCIQKRKTLFAGFKVKQQHIFGLALIDIGNLVRSAIVSGAFWESIGGKISRLRVGTANGQSEGLQVFEIGEPWPIYLEGMDECYILEPLVIQGLSHSENLGMAFLQKYRPAQRGSITNAHKRWVGLESPVGGRRMS